MNYLNARYYSHTDVWLVSALVEYVAYHSIKYDWLQSAGKASLL